MHKKTKAQLAKSLYHAHLQISHENSRVLKTGHISAREGEVAFTLDADGVEMPIRVKMKDYAFFVPRNAATLPVVLEGTFKQVTIPQDEAQHYADDEAAHTGKPAKKIEGDVDSWMFMASAVQIDHTKG